MEASSVLKVVKYRYVCSFRHPYGFLERYKNSIYGVNMPIDKLLELQQRSTLVIHRQSFTDLFILNRMPLIFSTFDTCLMVFPYLNANFFSFPFCSDKKLFTGIYSRPLGRSFCHSTGLGILTVYGLRNRDFNGSIILSVKSNAGNLRFIDRSFSNFHILRKLISITTRFRGEVAHFFVKQCDEQSGTISYSNSRNVL